MHTPPFCPNSECPLHHQAPSRPHWFVRDGHYRSAAHGPVQRFRCRHCGCRFSSQTFSIDYAVKRKVPYRRLFSLLISCAGIRDMGRILSVSPTCITNRISRLARQALAVHADLLSHLPLREQLVADGFESFAVSQYFPNNIQLLAAKDSQYWLFSDYAHLRRKGRMTAYQSRHNKQIQPRFTLGRVTVYESFSQLIRTALLQLESSPLPQLELFTDRHRSYRKALDDLRPQDRSALVHHPCSSTAPRTVSNELFSVNYLDREIRKDLAEHTRETVQFARNAVNQMERLAVYRAYHNYFKPYRIGGGREEGRITHAERAGIPGELIRGELKSFFTRRRFLSRVKGTMIRDRMVWLRAIKTPLKQFAEGLPAYAWA